GRVVDGGRIGRMAGREGGRRRKGGAAGFVSRIGRTPVQASIRGDRSTDRLLFVAGRSAGARKPIRTHTAGSCLDALRKVSHLVFLSGLQIAQTRTLE